MYGRVCSIGWLCNRICICSSVLNVCVYACVCSHVCMCVVYSFVFVIVFKRECVVVCYSWRVCVIAFVQLCVV